MTAIALVSAKGAPGVTTCAVLLTAVWPTAVLVEADPSGGDLRAWYTDPAGQPLRPDLGVVSLLTAHTPNGTGAVLEAGLLGHAQQLPGGLPVLVGPGSPAQADTLRGHWPLLATSLAAHDGVAIVDAGRLTHPAAAASPDPTLALLRTCATTLVVCRATIASVGHTRDLLARLQQLNLEAQLLLIGPSSARDDTARAVGLYPELVHVLPEDPTAALGLTGVWNRKLDRTPLVAAARHVAGTLHQQLHDAARANEAVANGAGTDGAGADGTGPMPYPATGSQPSMPAVTA